ncbi:transposase [Salmonella enterica subsp. enterica serovar Concord]|nr:transposase [Salmonella enterica subsp. enterica serovar Kampala]EGB9339866.1 transposase [Salmonella enterica]EGD0420041.1 transposase [Salmonella enterica subsp. enterica serovar Concord]EGF4691180.1 transposase [Salmonella enterica subsp. enterica serovar Concord]EGM6170633.1 transposase [Salmonella enterica subsp. enterica serovar Concord]
MWLNSYTKRSRQGFTWQWFASSKTCHCCGHKMPEMPLKVREWKCPACDADHDRDINAAINIQHKGITELMAAGHVVKAHRDCISLALCQLQPKR